MSEFFTQFISLLQANLNVLDLGAGSGRQAIAIAQRGCKVWAVDKNPAKVQHKLITWQTLPIETWLQKPSSTRYDAVLMNNIVQFFSKGWVTGVLIPELAKRTTDRCLFGIRTFFKLPEPAFENSTVLSYWTAQELLSLFPGWKCLHQNQQSAAAADMTGRERLFHNSSIIVQQQ